MESYATIKVKMPPYPILISAFSLFPNVPSLLQNIIGGLTG